jgi:hypothetical protein
LNGSVYTIPKTPFSERIILSIINAANKGTVVSVRDIQGNLKIYANAGKDNDETYLRRNHHYRGFPSKGRIGAERPRTGLSKK